MTEPGAILSVSQLTALIKAQLETAFPDLWVEGELSNLRLPASGHLYFTLKDEGAQVRAVLFRSAVRALRFTPKDGQQVLCRACLTVYEPRGEYEVVVEYLEPRGIGSLQLAFEELKARLAREGLFDPGRKRPLPALPRRIGLVTSPTGAAVRDFLKVLTRRFACVAVLIHPVPVQGTGAAEAIAGAIETLNRLGGAGAPDALDVIVLARGGGSLEDLWAFNEEVVARAIAASAVPVVSAVGHETDYTIADFVADLRAPTPSAAAEMIIPSQVDLVQQIEGLRARLVQTQRHRVETWRARLQQARLRLVDPRRRLELAARRLDDLAARLRTASLTLLDRQRQWMAHLASSLELLSPLAILARGYAIARRLPDRRILRSAAEARPGDRLGLRLHQGEVLCRVEENLPEAAPESS